MQGRNGVDQFARFTMGVALAAIVLTLFTGTRSGIGAFLDLFGMAAIVYTYFRIFSKNISLPVSAFRPPHSAPRP